MESVILPRMESESIPIMESVILPRMESESLPRMENVILPRMESESLLRMKRNLAKPETRYKKKTTIAGQSLFSSSRPIAKITNMTSVGMTIETFSSPASTPHLVLKSWT